MISRAPNRTAIAYRLAASTHAHEAQRWLDRANASGTPTVGFDFHTALRYLRLEAECLRHAVRLGSPSARPLRNK